jgi:small subunit ribosomal protein S8
MSSVTDPIADLLTRVRNAVKARHSKLDVPASTIKTSIIKIMKDEGFIKNYKIVENEGQNTLRIYLKYNSENESALLSLKRLSSPGRREYISVKDLRPVFNNMGIWILSTSKGIITNKSAKQLNVGGELICEIS